MKNKLMRYFNFTQYYNILPQGFFDAAKLTGAFTTYHGNENDLQMLLVEYGPVVTAINAAPLHHYHSGQIEGSLGDSDYLCCDANPDLISKQSKTTTESPAVSLTESPTVSPTEGPIEGPTEGPTESSTENNSNNTMDYNYYYDYNDYGYDQQECR